MHGPRRFLGELDLFSPQPVLRTAVVIRDGEVLRLTVDELQNALAQDAETRDLIVRAYLSRRAIRYELAADLRIIGRGESPEVRRLQQYAQAHHLTSAVIDIDTDEAGHHFLDKVGVTPTPYRSSSPALEQSCTNQTRQPWPRLSPHPEWPQLGIGEDVAAT